jgi:succinate dehydrogenase cytochrome b subunit
MKFPDITVRTRPNNIGLRGWAYAGRYGIERYLYLLQRITGLGVLIYLPMHILVTGNKLDETSWNWVMGLVTRLGPYGEFLVFAGAVFHGLNGIRLLFTEFGYLLTKPVRPVYPFVNAAMRQRPAVYAMFLLVAVIVIYGAYELFPFAFH